MNTFWCCLIAILNATACHGIKMWYSSQNKYYSSHIVERGDLSTIIMTIDALEHGPYKVREQSGASRSLLLWGGAWSIQGWGADGGHQDHCCFEVRHGLSKVGERTGGIEISAALKWGMAHTWLGSRGGASRSLMRWGGEWSLKGGGAEESIKIFDVLRWGMVHKKVGSHFHRLIEVMVNKVIRSWSLNFRKHSYINRNSLKYIVSWFHCIPHFADAALNKWNKNTWKF